MLCWLGIRAGDEIVVINGKIVSDLDMVYVETLLTETSAITFILRTVHTPHPAVAMETPPTLPPPPSQTHISDVDSLKIPPPSSGELMLMLICRLNAKNIMYIILGCDFWHQKAYNCYISHFLCRLNIEFIANTMLSK